jgi:two-component system, chemotaxis family, chemotaxis protein CheY
MTKILIVDDSETMRAQLKRDLEAKGFQVVEGTDGINGLEVLSANPDVKLIICDVNMPRLDGLDMAKKIHEVPSQKSLPILIMTTEASSALKAKGKDAGVLAWVTKPYVAAKLLPVVEKIVK